MTTHTHENLMNTQTNTRTAEKKDTMLEPFTAASAMFAYHTTILFSHDMLEANADTFHIKLKSITG